MSIFKRFSSQKGQEILNLSFLNEILYYTTHASNMDSFAEKITNAISKYIGASAVYVINKNINTIELKYSMIKDIPKSFKIRNYKKFSHTLINRGSSDLNIKQMELSNEISSCVSFDEHFSILPLVAVDVQFPVGIIVIDADFNYIDTSKLQVLSMALILIANSINYALFVQRNTKVSNYVIKTILKIVRFGNPSIYWRYIRIKGYSLKLAKLLEISQEDIRRLHFLALLHCIRRIDITCDILCEEGLFNKEFEIIKRHIKNGYELLKDISSINNYLFDMIDNKQENSEKIAQILLVANTIDNSTCDVDLDCIKNELENNKDKYDEDVIDAALNLIESDRFMVMRKRFEKSKELANAIGFVDQLKMKTQNLKDENEALKNQLERYEELLKESEEKLKNITQSPQSRMSKKYRDIVNTVFDYINPMSIVFVQIKDRALHLERVKGTPINLEYSIQLLPNKKVFQALSSKEVYVSHRLIAFPLFENDAICIFLSNDSVANEETVEIVKNKLENIVKT